MLTYYRHRYLTRWPRRLAFALAIVLLLAACARIAPKQSTGFSHAREVAARAVVDLGPCINPSSLHIHQIAAEEMASYMQQSELAEEGYLVTYVCEVEKRHLDIFTLFINRADKVSPFTPSVNLEQFARRYGVDYRRR